jgi:hypothetical protein
MKKSPRIQASQLPNGDGHQVTYESGTSRKLHQFINSDVSKELSPHGAGSFHDPEHHQTLMSRVQDYIKKNKQQS